jgi:flagellar protein FliS
MIYGDVKARYASNDTATASPARLLTMLYDRLVTDLVSAEAAMLTQDYEAIGYRIGHAQEILLELHNTLDTSAWPQGEALAQLYVWMVTQLNTARLELDHAKVAGVRALVEPLRQAWHAAALQVGQAGLPAAQVGAGGLA